MDCGYDKAEGRRQVLGVGLGRCRNGGDRDMADEGVHVEAAGNHYGVHFGSARLQSVYRGR